MQLKLAIMAATLVTLGQAHADLYDITFTGVDDLIPNEPVSASGVIDVVGGIAQSGYLNVIGGANPGIFRILLPPNNDGVFAWDNVVNPSATPFLDSTGSSGLVFANGTRAEVNLWYSLAPSNWGDPGSDYGLWGYPTQWAPQAFGTATVSEANGVAVPEPAALVSGVLMLLPIGVSVLRIVRRRKVA